MSSGVLPQAGYIYQDGVVIFMILTKLVEKNIKECFIELEITKRTHADNPESYNLDFSILTVNPEKHEFYEVKDKKKLDAEDVKNILINFYKFYSKYKSSSNTKFVLLHSKVEPSKSSNFWLFDNKNLGKVEMLSSHIEEGKEGEKSEFVVKVEGYTIADTPDSFVNTNDLILRTYALIDRILADHFLKTSSYTYGDVKQIYDSMVGEYRNRISNEAKRLKLSGTQTVSSDVEEESIIKISLYDLLQTRNGIIDVIFNRMEKSERKIQGITNRTELIRQFNRHYLNTADTYGK